MELTKSIKVIKFIRQLLVINSLLIN